MKKNKISIFCLSVVAVLSCIGGITSCNSNNNSSSNTSSGAASSSVVSSSYSSSSSSSSVLPPDGHYSKWSEDDQALMKKYCGEILPYPEGLTSGDIVVEEITGEDYYAGEYAYLEITNNASSFTFKDYYKIAEQFGWNAIKTYNGNVVQSSGDGFEFVEMVKKSSMVKTLGYDIVYLFTPEVKDSDGNIITEAKNVMRCYPELTGNLTQVSEFSDDNLELMEEVLTTTDIPYIKLGAYNQIGYLNSNTFGMIDTYAKDLSKENADLFVESGFTLNKDLSNQYDSYVLEKQLQDGATLQVNIYYYQGNKTYIYYEPKETTYNSWPTQVINEIKDLSGVTIPEFPIAEGGTYKTYKKHDTYYIYTLTIDSEYDYDFYNYTMLQDPKFTWNETINFSATELTDDDYDMVGFLISATIETPSSTFHSSWPSDLINTTIKDTFKISGISLPNVDTSSLPYPDMKIKSEFHGPEEFYEYYLEDVEWFPEYYGLDADASAEEIKAKAQELANQAQYLRVSIMDNDFQARDAYEQKLTDLGWYKGYDEWNATYFEDPEGKIKISFDGYGDENFDCDGPTYIDIQPGSGETHSPELSLDEEVNIGIGRTDLIHYSTSMLPYPVTFTSSDPENFTISKIYEDYIEVTVSDSVSEGSQATITATVTKPDGTKIEKTCTVTAYTVITYTPAQAIDTINTQFASIGLPITPTVYHPTEEDEHHTLTVNLGSDCDLLTIQSTVEDCLIPNGFETLDPEWFDYDADADDTLEIDGVKYAASERTYAFEDEDDNIVIIKYWIYKDANNNYNLFVEAF